MWLKSLVLLCVIVVGHVHGQGESPAILSNPEFLENPTSEMMVVLKESVIPVLRDLAAKSYPNRGAKLNAVATALKAATSLSQAPVIAALRPFKLEIQQFWATNRIFIKNGNPAVAKLLQSLQQVKEIRAPKLPSFPPLNPIEGTPPDGNEWNIEIIKAPEVWEIGSDGAGAIVMGIDTGVRYTHNAIKDSWVGADNKGWFDPWYKQNKPSDINGHGTHTIATVLGRTGSGVAPGAQWMACRACDTQGCPEPHLIDCGQFALCPTDPDGRNSQCEQAPHIVTNSWGGKGGEDFFDEIIEAWRTSGIIPIFAIGNDGPKCNTAASPGDRDGVLAVGATDKDDKIAKFSSRGPRQLTEGQVEGIFKPQVVAPGHKVNSAFSVTDNSYRVLSGTSMACPAVAGAAALLVAKNPDLTIDDITRLFTATADQDLQPSGTQCGDNTDSEYPNEVYGYGRINCLKAYKQMLSEMGTNEPTIKSTKVNN